MSKNVKAEFLRNGCIRLIRPFGEVPRGFTSDGASVPRLFWWIFGHPYDKHHIRGGIRHDWRYKTGAVPRAVADAEYRRDLIEDGMWRAFAWAEWFAVRLCGRSRYNKQHKAKEQTK